MSQTTSIHDLPIDPAGSRAMESNVNLVVSESALAPDQKMENNTVNLDQTTINQIINGLQQASATGITNLPSRDIPRNTENLTQDPYIQPNYVPPAETKHYIEDDVSEDIILNYQKKIRKDDALDSFYDEIQIPLLLIITYFIFQLPIFKSTLFRYLPFLSNKDGNMNVQGFIVTSILYGSSYYFLSKIILNLNNL